MSWRRTRPPALREDAPALSDDEALVRAAQRGDLDAYNRLVRTHERQAYAVALRLLRRPELAEDATQDAFIQAYRALDSFRGGSFQRAGLNLREYGLAITNSLNDRLYLATKSGLVICLREIGLVTPPFGLNLFTIHGVLPKFSVMFIARSSLPFLAVMILMVWILIFFPGLAMWLPQRLY